MKTKLLARFKNTEKKSEEEKMRLIWFWTIILMVGIFWIWAANASRNFANLGRKGLDISGLPEFPQTENIDIDKALQESGQIISEYSEQEKAQWEKIGEDYVFEKNILANDGFSSLKLTETAQKDGKTVLKYEQYYKGVPVPDGRLVLLVDPESKTASEQENTVRSGIDLSVDPAISAKEAAEIATKEAGEEYAFKEAALLIAEDGGKYYLIWQADFEKEGDNNIRKIFVGAKHGGIFSTEQANKKQTPASQLKNVTE